MKTNNKTLGLLIQLCALAFPRAAPAQSGPDGTTADYPGHGWMRGPGARAFDPNSMTTFQGDIVDVQRIARGRHQGVHLTVAMGSEHVTVHLGPDFYVDNQPLKLAKGDKVEVKGARTTVNGQSVVIALEVRLGDQVLALRDTGGVPLWRGQGMGRR
jgi:hypothetical protein